jgi:hypothetical protein
MASVLGARHSSGAIMVFPTASLWLA